MNELIYIADDEKNICELMSRFLESAGYRTVCFESGESILAAIEKKVPDLIILDIMMPGISGLDVCAKVRSNSTVPIMIVSAKDSPIDRIEGISLGSDDYLVKPFLPLELVSRVGAIFRLIEMARGGACDPDELSFADVPLIPGKRIAYISGKPLPLTPAEFDFLVYMIKNRERAVSRDELLKKLWQYDYDIPGTRAADDLVKRLRKKLASYGSSLGIEAVWGFGFRLTDGGDAK